MKQEWNVVAADIEVLAVNVRYVRQSIQVLDGWPVGIVHDHAVFAIGNPKNLFERLALRIFNDRVIEFLAADDIDYFGFHQSLFRQNADVRSHEGDLDGGICFLDGLGNPHVALKARGTGEEHEQFVILGDANGFFGADVMRWGVE